MLKKKLLETLATTSSESLTLSSPSNNTLSPEESGKNFQGYTKEKGIIYFYAFFLEQENLKKIARLAHLELSEKDIINFSKQLTDILSYVEKLNEVNTKDVEATSQVTGLENVTRKDETKPSLSQEEALSNSKSIHNGLFKVKAILGE